MDKTVMFLLASLVTGVIAGVTLWPMVPPKALRPALAAVFVAILLPYFFPMGSLELLARTLWSPLFVGALGGYYLLQRFLAWKKTRLPKVTQAQREARRERERQERRALRRAQREAEKAQAQERDNSSHDEENLK